MELSATPAYPPEVNAAEEARLVQAVKDWAMAHGLAVRPPLSLVSAEMDPDDVLATGAPVTLFPSRFPRACFEQARDIQRAYNELYAKVSQDQSFLGAMMAAVDDVFVTRLFQIHSRIAREGYKQPLSLGLFRSDYLVHQDPASPSRAPQIKQVEFNTISASFAGLSEQTCRLHKFLRDNEYPLLKGLRGAADSLDLPENRCTAGLAAGLRAAFVAYGDSKLGLERCVLFVVQDGERNVFDQRHLEYALVGRDGEAPRIPVFRLPFADVVQRTTIADTGSAAASQLLYALPSDPHRVFEVAVVYLRAGYGPADYPDDAAWEARYHLERSAAIKCPTVLTQLAGTKKVQQLLAAPATASSPSGLARFLDDGASQARQIARTFANIYPIGDDSDAARLAHELATDPARCEGFVLKPQREGGGNNIYRGAIPAFLRSIPKAQWSAYILMELITPARATNSILRLGRVEKGGIISELGVFGTCLWNNETGEVLQNEEAGYVLRTKGDQSDEGGVAAGYGCMDSCNLV